MDASQSEPGWSVHAIQPGYHVTGTDGWIPCRHCWLAHMVDSPPNQDKILQSGIRKWEAPKHIPNLTQSRAAYKPYSTYVDSPLTERGGSSHR